MLLLPMLALMGCSENDNPVIEEEIDINTPKIAERPTRFAEVFQNNYWGWFEYATIMPDGSRSANFFSIDGLRGDLGIYGWAPAVFFVDNSSEVTVYYKDIVGEGSYKVNYMYDAENGKLSFDVQGDLSQLPYGMDVTSISEDSICGTGDFFFHDEYSGGYRENEITPGAQKGFYKLVRLTEEEFEQLR